MNKNTMQIARYHPPPDYTIISDNPSIDELVCNSILKVAIQLYVERIIQRVNQMKHKYYIAEQLPPPPNPRESLEPPTNKEVTNAKQMEVITTTREADKANREKIEHKDTMDDTKSEIDINKEAANAKQTEDTTPAYEANNPETDHKASLDESESDADKVRRSSRIGKPTPKTKQDWPPKGEAKNSAAVVQETLLSSICPGCATKVKKGSKGVVCESCLAYWHYPCAGVDDKMVKDLGKAGFYCSKHASHEKPKTEKKAIENQEHKSRITEMEKELLSWKEKYEREEKESKRSGKEIKEKESEITKLMGELMELKTNHEKFLQKNQILLDSLGNSIIQLKKEKANHLQSIKKAHNQIGELEEKNECLVKDNKKLEEENKAHIEFVTNNISSKDIDTLKKVEDENRNLKQQIEKHQKAEVNVAQAKAKVSEKTKELNLIKEQIDALENRIGEMTDENKEYKENWMSRLLNMKKKETTINCRKTREQQPTQKKIQEQQTQTTDEGIILM